MPAPIYFSNGRQVTPEEALKLGENVSPEDISPQIQAQQPIAETVKPTINPVQSEYNNYNDPLSSIKNFFTPFAETVSDASDYIGTGINKAGKSISDTASDVGNWADRNRVGLGGFATAIGAGFARRDPSEALANYNKSIIQNKQQAQEEEKFKMATDGSHPYNQQFRELFAKMLPDVTKRLGDRFGNMTVQNFKDAGLTDLLDVTQKQIEISKNDPNSSISKRTRDMASSQYEIQIPENVSANEVPNYIAALKNKNEMANKQKEIGIKQGTLDAKKEATLMQAQKAEEELRNQRELTGLKQEQNARESQLFPSSLEEAKVKAEIAKQTQESTIAEAKAKSNKEQYLYNSMDSKSDLSKNAKKSFLKSFPKYSYLISDDMSSKDIKDIETNVIPDLRKTELMNINSINRQKIQSGALIQAQQIRDKNANYRASLMNRLGERRLGETTRHNIATEEINRKKMNEKYADTYISQGDLSNQGLSQPAISKKLESGSGARELIRNANSIMNNIDNLKPTDALGLTELSGQLQSLYTNMGLDVKQNKALGAYDQGVRDLLSEMAVNPNSVKAYAKKQYLKGQYKAVINSVNNAYKAKSIQQKWDERVGSPVDYTLKLNKAVIDNDPEAMQEFSDLGYGSDDLLKAYKNSMPLKRKGE
jgi:hypothetical protein